MLALLAEEEERAREAGRLRRPRTMWVRPWLQRRPLLGQYERLMAELERESRGDFRGFLRMEPEMFHELLNRVGPRITKSAQSRPPLDPGLKLAITLRFLATGDSYHRLQYSFRVAPNTISLFVPEVCDALLEEYRQAVHNPSTPAEWLEVERTAARWNWHHCCGAIDGKHVRIVKPRSQAAITSATKGSIPVLLGLVDGNYKFIWANVGAPGQNLTVVSSTSQDLTCPERGNPWPADPAHFPVTTGHRLLPGRDDAFPLRKYMMKPTPSATSPMTSASSTTMFQRAAGRENAFGIMAARWRAP